MRSSANTVTSLQFSSVHFSSQKILFLWAWSMFYWPPKSQWSLYIPHSDHYMYRTQRSLYVPHSGHCMYRTVVTISTASLTFNNSTFCPHSVFMCFVWIWEQTEIISLYSIKETGVDWRQGKPISKSYTKQNVTVHCTKRKQKAWRLQDQLDKDAVCLRLYWTYLLRGRTTFCK